MSGDLQRFVDAQSQTYDQALAELRAGEKRTHWMWFVFPQIAGLGRSPTAQHFAVSGLDEARAYLTDPVLGRRLVEAATACWTNRRGMRGQCWGRWTPRSCGRP